MDKLLAMKMFVATVDAQGFSAAARRLGLATSSVTRLVDALETAVGASLLNRSTRQVSLTEAGARYYERARSIFEALDEADASVADRGEEPVGVLRLCLPVEFGRRVIARTWGRFWRGTRRWSWTSTSATGWMICWTAVMTCRFAWATPHPMTNWCAASLAASSGGWWPARHTWPGVTRCNTPGNCWSTPACASVTGKRHGPGAWRAGRTAWS